MSRQYNLKHWSYYIHSQEQREINECTHTCLFPCVLLDFSILRTVQDAQPREWCHSQLTGSSHICLIKAVSHRCDHRHTHSRWSPIDWNCLPKWMQWQSVNSSYVPDTRKVLKALTVSWRLTSFKIAWIFPSHCADSSHGNLWNVNCVFYLSITARTGICEN